MSHQISPEYLLKVGREAAEKASAIAIEQRASQSVSVSFKGIRDIVTSADIACEKAIVETIKREFSDHLILAEETAQTHPPERYGDGYVWIIDPIDGTTNYAHGHYQVGISIACALNGEVVAAIVNAPFLRETFTATKNGGAFLNDTRINCRSVS